MEKLLTYTLSYGRRFRKESDLFRWRFSKGSDDIEAQNLIDLLKLDDAGLADERKRYIKRKREEILLYGLDSKAYFQVLMSENPIGVSYIRAIKEEFNIDIWEMLP